MVNYIKQKNLKKCNMGTKNTIFLGGKIIIYYKIDPSGILPAIVVFFNKLILF